MEERINPFKVNGWGVDADPRNDPTYPMKKRNNGEHEGYSWERPAQQQSDVEVLHSNERPGVTAVYGTTAPPRGLSGAIRRKAFNYSESSYGHWLPLMAADRINMVEGVLGDLSHGRIPNVWAERGWNAEWRHNRADLLGRVFAGAITVSALAGFLYYLGKRR